MALPSADKVVCFTLAGQLFGIPIDAVKETVQARPLTRVPLVPEVVSGLLNLRGEVVAVLDLPRVLGLPAELARAGDPGQALLGGGAHLLVLRSTRNQARAAAALGVDELLGVRAIPPAEVRPVPTTIAASAASFLSGVAQDGDPPRPLLLLDPARVLDCEPLRPFRARTS